MINTRSEEWLRRAPRATADRKSRGKRRDEEDVEERNEEAPDAEILVK